MTVVIAGHELPHALSQALASGAWPVDVALDHLREVFGEEPDQSGELYSVDEMQGETSRWQSEEDPAYLGRGPETLDPKQSVLIGDLGVDRPFGLDLRADPPDVRFLTIDGRWVRVAGSVDELLARLGLM